MTLAGQVGDGIDGVDEVDGIDGIDGPWPVDSARRRPGSSVPRMEYLVGASRIQLIRLKHLKPGTRVQAVERIPSGTCHAVESPDAAEGLCGAEVIEVLDRSFTADSDLLKCSDCEKLVKQ